METGKSNKIYCVTQKYTFLRHFETKDQFLQRSRPRGDRIEVFKTLNTFNDITYDKIFALDGDRYSDQKDGRKLEM